MTIHDAQGRQVRTVFEGRLPAGRQSFVWDGRSDRGARATTGAYYSRLTSASGEISRKLTLLH